MTTLFSAEELARLEIDAGALGATEHLPVPQPAVDEARGLSARDVKGDEEVRPFAQDLGAGDPILYRSSRPLKRDELRRVRSDALAALGISAAFDEEQFVLSLSAPPDLAFTIVHISPRSDAHDASTSPPIVQPRPMQPASTIRDGQAGPAEIPVRQSLRDTFRSVIATRGGVALGLLAFEDGTLHVQPVYAWPSPPIAHWLEHLMDDSLRQLVTEPRPADRWVETTLAGLLARLQLPPDAGGARARIAAWRAGDEMTSAGAARVWLRSFTEAQRDAVERFARVRAASLGPPLTVFLDKLTRETAHLDERWRALCHERDDLESVRVLLREAGAGTALEQALQQADEQGRAIRFSWPRDVVVDDERLRRVALTNPAAWWGSTVYEVHLL